MTDNPPQPVPRLRHVMPGQAIRLQGVPRVLVLLTTDRHYGYFTDMKASLCHPVDREMMVFGDGGWRVNEQGMT
jgi:hypothetical protein